MCVVTADAICVLLRSFVRSFVSQILGAEKALFRALKKKGNTPKCAPPLPSARSGDGYSLSLCQDRRRPRCCLLRHARSSHAPRCRLSISLISLVSLVFRRDRWAFLLERRDMTCHHTSGSLFTTKTSLSRAGTASSTTARSSVARPRRTRGGSRATSPTRCASGQRAIDRSDRLLLRESDRSIVLSFVPSK